ncbi:sensor histidine kinase [Neptuniibacter sp. CAU 1671]|uniref:HAMP domain-containing sensor histidine kinase n=1 Tax=Neptuniibacter sp. CAU 1671 TaxID=3032593 RepID=UPI0023DCD2F8|nr:sensor histidine kinase [Neptuniibacter sp. CAU 1671]MDF2180754.1 sensor histidine kinase [Neptuniibacter sp. CAU 1671]
MSAVLRLNLIVTLVFAMALGFTLWGMLQQASKDISREVNSGVGFTQKLLGVVANYPELIDSLLEGHIRHVHLEVIEDPDQYTGITIDPDVLRERRFKKEVAPDLPDWFAGVIPGIQNLEDRYYLRYLPDGRALRLRADISDEVGEVWESTKQILILFLVAAMLSNLAIFLGVRFGLKPVADLLSALSEIKLGHYNARLGQYSMREVNQIAEHFNQMAGELQTVELENRALTNRLMNLQESERSHLARELHDDLGQYLTGIRAQAYLVSQLQDKPDMIERVSQQIIQNCEAMQLSFRQLIRSLHPVILEQLGLREAINTLVENWSETHQIEVETELTKVLPQLSDVVNTHLYRIVQEALHNIARHAQANRVDITLCSDDNGLTLSIRDNGVGFDPLARNVGVGIRSMRERAAYIDAVFEIGNRPEGGTEVLLSLPVKQGASA